MREKTDTLHYIYKKSKGNEQTKITARQLENLLLGNKGKFTLREYNKLMNMELVESPVRDAIHELKHIL